MHLDIVGPLLAIQWYRYCVAMIDRFTRWSEATPVQDAAKQVAEAVNTWVARFSAPNTINTDQGTQFESQLFKALISLVVNLLELQHIIQPPMESSSVGTAH